MLPQAQPLLTPQEALFVDHFLLHGNGPRAAEHAGYPTDVLETTAERLLADPRLITSIADYQYTVASLRGINSTWIMDKLVQIVHRCMAPQPVMSTAGNQTEQIRQDGEGLWAFDSQGATAALALIGRHIGFFSVDNQQRWPREFRTSRPLAAEAPESEGRQ